MRFTEIRSFKPILLARRYVKRTAVPIEGDKSVMKTHIKRTDQGYLYINQYDDQWYQITFKDPAISNFEDFFRLKFSHYFEIINKDGLNLSEEQ